MDRIKFGYVISEVTPTDALDLGVMAEKYGLDSIFVPDHMMDFDGCRVDPWVILSAIGTRTKNLFLSPSVVDFQRCHPAKTAQIVATLDSLTDGRAGLGIGAGEAMNTLPYGIEWQSPSLRIAKLREAIEVVKRLWTATKAEPSNYKGMYYRLNDAWLDQAPVRKPHPPVYIGALGSSVLLEITGEIADGWLPFMNTPESYARRYEKVKKGIVRAGRRVEDVDAAVLIFPTFLETPGTKEKALSLARAYLAAEQNTLKLLGYPITSIPEYSYQQTVVSKAAFQAAVESSKDVPLELVTQFVPTTVDECISMVEKFMKVGARHFLFREIDRGSKETVVKVGSKVIPYFKESEHESKNVPLVN